MTLIFRVSLTISKNLLKDAYKKVIKEERITIVSAMTSYRQLTDICYPIRNHTAKEVQFMGDSIRDCIATKVEHSLSWNANTSHFDTLSFQDTLMKHSGCLVGKHVLIGGME